MAAAVCSSPASRSEPRNEPGMQDEIVGANRQCAFHFSAECFDGFLEKQLIRAGQVHQIIGVDHERLKIILGPQTKHFLAHRMAQLIRRPLAWAGGKNLQRIAAQAVGALGGIVNSSGSGGMDADAPGSEPRRAFWRGMGEDILFAGHGAGHWEKYKVETGRAHGQRRSLVPGNYGPRCCVCGAAAQR